MSSQETLCHQAFMYPTNEQLPGQGPSALGRPLRGAGLDRNALFFYQHTCAAMGSHGALSSAEESAPCFAAVTVSPRIGAVGLQGG